MLNNPSQCSWPELWKTSGENINKVKVCVCVCYVYIYTGYVSVILTGCETLGQDCGVNCEL